jgi:2,3,4,5-tetrahydropyridine-2,6-dicarboxylate N-succinyltransferase
MEALKATIEAAYTDRGLLANASHADAVRETIALLDSGELRVAEKRDGAWQVNGWAKQAILLYFSVAKMEVMEVGPFEYYDKIPLKKQLEQQGVRVVPPGVIRYGAHVERGAVVMPGYVNIGAYVGAKSMVDTWATVGSCAQIGRGVHLSGGVGIGGVLEPPGAAPVIIEDGAFIGSRSIIVEGAIVEENAVVGAGTVITASTPIIDVRGDEEIILKGRVPSGAVVVPGTRPKRFPAGTYHMPCALIIGERQDSTDRKTSLNEVLREFAVDV